jgi:chromosome segregation protein
VARAEQELAGARSRLTQAQSEQAGLAEQRETRLRSLRMALETARTRLHELEEAAQQQAAALETAKRDVAPAEAKAEKLKQRYLEFRDLLAQGYISAREAQTAQQEYEGAAAALAAARERVTRADAARAASDLQAQAAAVRQAEASLRAAEAEPPTTRTSEAVSAAETQLRQAKAALEAARKATG